MKLGIVLFAHGSREAAWARPFEAIAAELRKDGSAEVAVAYLETMKPTLLEALAALAARRATAVRVVPVFLGLGGHLKQDLPKLVAEARAARRKARVA